MVAVQTHNEQTDRASLPLCQNTPLRYTPSHLRPPIQAQQLCRNVINKLENEPEDVLPLLVKCISSGSAALDNAHILNTSFVMTKSLLFCVEPQHMRKRTTVTEEGDS